VTRVAAIDVGTNAMRCVLVEVGEDHEPLVLENVRTPVRLGSHVFLTGQIGSSAGDRAVEAFRGFRGMIDKLDVTHVQAVATSAFREASDAEVIRDRIREETGIEVRVISGAEEAHLVRRAIGSVLDLSRGRTGAVDVGGGSVEVLVMKDGDVVRAESFDMGAVRLLEALPGDGGTDFFSLLTEYVEAIRARVLTAMGREPLSFLAATGGSIVTLAELAGDDAVGEPVLREGVRVIPLARLNKWVRKLAAVSFHERIEQFGLREDRADVILPAGVVYLKIGEIFGVDRIFVPSVGLKDGLILDTIDELARLGALEERRREIRATALGLGRRYHLDEPHGVRVADLALSLFDQLGNLHGLGEDERTLLETAAILHDVGLYVSMAKHHKHSYYLISESDLVGLDRREREIVANVARYHRKASPTAKHPPFAALSREDRILVERLAAILRAADVLDREHRQNVQAVKVRRGENEILLELEADGDLLLERWAARRKFGLFGAVFGVKLALAEK
jgi:exopolyphosphatase/guanosine-5'-triphosphate,3'-diphosphate pyrophosphatase